MSGHADPGPAPAAEPTIGPLLSGTASWVRGVHVWTDYVYDDRGLQPGTEPDYPSAASPGNAADLVQLQLRLQGGDLGIRTVLQTLVDPAAPLLGVGLDLDGNPRTGAPSLPGDAWHVSGTPLGLERLVLVHDSTAQVLEWTGAGWVAIGQVPAVVDPAANTMDTVVPKELLGPISERWRVVGALGLGLPGHSWVDGDGPIRDLAYVRDTSSSNFQSNVQAAVLSGEEDAARATAAIDAAHLRGRHTALAEPEPGIKNTLLYRSHLDLGEGIREGSRKYAGPYQPYAAWFPEDLPPHPGLVVFMHGAGGTHMSGSYGDDGAFLAGIGPGTIAPRAVVVTAPRSAGEHAALRRSR